MEPEEWRPVVRFEGLYEISNLGNVRRVKRGKRFSAEQVSEAKKMFSGGAELKEVAEFLGTSITTAFSIKHAKTWNGDTSCRPMKTSAGTDHYLRFAACKDGKYTRVAVHRALWEAFVGPIEGRLEVNHKNLDRQDNRLENLEILTHRENVRHAFAIYMQEQAGQPKRGRGSPRGRYFKHGQ